MLKILKVGTVDGKTKWHVMGDAADPVLVCDSEEEATAYVANAEKKKTDNRRVFRVDAAGQLRKPVKMANGWLKVDGHLTRTGIFVYRNSDGSPRRELRLPEDVFHQDSLETFAMVPVTDDHPPQFLDANNTSGYQRGHIGESVVRDGKMMRASMLITDAALVAKIEKGKAVEISNGYTCDLEEKSGVTDDGEKYDCIQRNIVANHVAIVPVGRAGPEARVRMDSGADVLLSISGDGAAPSLSPAQPEKQPVKKIRIDGVEYDAGSEQAQAAQIAYQAKLDAEQKTRAEADAKRADADAKRDAEIKALKDLAEKNQARADAADEAAKKAAKDLKDAPAKVTAELKARMSLEASAKKVLGAKAAAKFDSLDDKAIKLAVLKQTNPDLKLDGKSDAYVDARFDHAIELFDEEEGDDEGGEDGVTAARRVVTDTEDGDDSEPGDPSEEMSEDEANAKHTDSQTAHEAMAWRHRNEWKKPIGGEKASE